MLMMLGPPFAGESDFLENKRIIRVGIECDPASRTCLAGRLNRARRTGLVSEARNVTYYVVFKTASDQSVLEILQIGGLAYTENTFASLSAYCLCLYRTELFPK